MYRYLVYTRQTCTAKRQIHMKNGLQCRASMPICGHLPLVVMVPSLPPSALAPSSCRYRYLRKWTTRTRRKEKEEGKRKELIAAMAAVAQTFSDVNGELDYRVEDINSTLLAFRGIVASNP